MPDRGSDDGGGSGFAKTSSADVSAKGGPALAGAAAGFGASAKGGSALAGAAAGLGASAEGGSAPAGAVPGLSNAPLADAPAWANAATSALGGPEVAVGAVEGGLVTISSIRGELPSFSLALSDTPAPITTAGSLGLAATVLTGWSESLRVWTSTNWAPSLG